MVQVLHLDLLGGLRITEGGEPLPGLATHKGQALLCYLALTRRPHTRDALATLLWSDDPQEEARASLRNVLFLLRKVASNYLVVTRDTVAFNPESPYRLDVDFFRDRFAAAGTAAGTPSAKQEGGMLAALREAMDLYQGEFMDGFYLLGASVFEEWVVTERQWLHGLAIEALHRLASEYAQLGDSAAAITYLNRLLVLEPWREEARRDLILLLAETGQRSAALSQYEACRRILLTELGVEPDEETTALYKQILAGAISPKPTQVTQPSPGPAPRPPDNLPAALTPILGRDMELAQLVDRMRRPALRLLTLVGPGGIGKTRLAIEVASQLLPDFPDGVFFVALAALRDVELVPATVAQALEVEEAVGTSYLDALKARLAQRKVLLVLDNFEHLLDATGTLLDLLQAAPDLKTIVTSREHLASIGEHVYHVQPLPLPDPSRRQSLQSLDQYSSIALFCARAEAVRFDFELTLDNAPSVTDICRRLDGNPLAIELAAARAGEMEAAELDRRLDNRFRLLTKGNRGAPERHQTLRACIEWSYDLLSEADRHLLSQVSVFAGGWTIERALEMLSYTSESDLSDGMQRLVDKSLVVLDPNPDTGRYNMHESIRQYAGDKLEEAGDARTLRDLHLNYFVALAEAAEPNLRGPDAAKWLDTLDAERDNLRAAFDWLQQRDGDREERATLLLRLSGALWRFWIIRDNVEEGSRRIGSALSAMAAVETDHRGQFSNPTLIAWSKALTGAAVMMDAGGDYAGARRYLEKNLAICRVLGDKNSIASALNNLAQPVKEEGDLALARQLSEESLALKRELGDKNGIHNSLATLGRIAFDLGDYSTALSFSEESLALARELQHQQRIANELNNLGRVLLEMGHYDRAGATFEESLSINRELGDRPGLGRVLGHLGQLAAHQGDYRRALALQKESIEYFRQAGHIRDLSENLVDIALIVGALGRALETARLMGAAEAVGRATNYRSNVADKARIEQSRAIMRSATEVDSSRLEVAYKEGVAMTVDQAISAALEAHMEK